MATKEVLIWQSRYQPDGNYFVQTPRLYVNGMPDQLVLVNGTTVVVEFKDDILTIKRTEE